MKFAKLFLPVFILSFFISLPSAKAGLLIEPVVGFSKGNFESQDDNEEYPTSGLSFGGRLGYQNLGFQLGVDYLSSTLGVDKKGWGDLEVSEWAAFVGYKFPVMLRVYAGYILRSVGNTDYENVDIKLEDGSGTKLGIGFTGLPFVNINFEIRRGTWDQYKLNNITVKEETTFDTFMIGVSLPFNI
jgi:hypothetical protein